MRALWPYQVAVLGFQVIAHTQAPSQAPSPSEGCSREAKITQLGDSGQYHSSRQHLRDLPWKPLVWNHTAWNWHFPALLRIWPSDCNGIKELDVAWGISPLDWGSVCVWTVSWTSTSHPLMLRTVSREINTYMCWFSKALKTKFPLMH